jgi:hypothetical protein
MKSGGLAGVRRCTAGGAMIKNVAPGDRVSLVVVAIFIRNGRDDNYSFSVARPNYSKIS